MSFAEGFKEARLAAERALSLEADLPQALAALGWVQRTADWDWKGAEKSFRRALALAPRNAEILRDTAVMVVSLGRIEEALPLARQAVDLDPLNAAGYNFLAILFQRAGRMGEAEQAMTKAIELAPTAVFYHSAVSLFQIAQGHSAQAAASAELEPSEAYRLFARGYVQYSRGDRAAGEATQREFIAKHAEGMGLYIAAVYVAAGEKDRAFEWLERAFTQRDSALAWIKTNPMLGGIHDDARWPVLLRKLGLTDEQLK